ncbi:hypothetical protein [Kitasatospora sp. NPDC094015]|uniref:hypothetical protein n=1 Tax=Kitasatospora sp. NPDC094015 TaxID=3155205 RepID=UPI0033216C8C
MRTRAAFLTTAAVTAVLGLAACGSSATGTSPGGATSTGTPAAAPTPTTRSTSPTPTATRSSTGATRTAEPSDVEITACTTDPAQHLPSAELTITNHAAVKVNYSVRVEFLTAAGVSAGEGAVTVTGLAAGQVSTQQAHGAAALTGLPTCRLIEVTHYPSP